MPPTPKSAALRQRRNKTVTAATISADEGRDVPELPARTDGCDWHPMVMEWWESVWRSPMASEYLDADMRGGLYLLADLYQVRWNATSHTGLIEAAKEIRLQEVRFGLTPIDRRRLQWEVERGEQAAEKVSQRRQTKRAQKESKGGDPRNGLKVA